MEFSRKKTKKLIDTEIESRMETVAEKKDCFAKILLIISGGWFLLFSITISIINILLIILAFGFITFSTWMPDNIIMYYYLCIAVSYIPAKKKNNNNENNSSCCDCCFCLFLRYIYIC